MVFFEPHDEMKVCIISEHNQRAVYDYEKLVDYFFNCFTENGDKPEETMESAIEWIDYNVIRAIPYLGEDSPIIVSKVTDDFREEDESFIIIDSEEYRIIS